VSPAHDVDPGRNDLATVDLGRRVRADAQFALAGRRYTDGERVAVGGAGRVENRVHRRAVQKREVSGDRQEGRSARADSSHRVLQVGDVAVPRRVDYRQRRGIVRRAQALPRRVARRDDCMGRLDPALDERVEHAVDHRPPRDLSEGLLRRAAEAGAAAAAIRSASTRSPRAQRGDPREFGGRAEHVAGDAAESSAGPPGDERRRRQRNKKRRETR